MALIDFAPAISAGIIGAATAVIAGQIANQNAERREARNREADEHRERLRDLRAVTDDATLALRDLWGILGSFAYAIPAGNPPVSRRSPTEARNPDPAAYVDAYERLTNAHIRLLNRVERGDTFQSPVGRAVADTQAAFNAVVHEDPYEPREPKSRNAILKANGTVQDALRELQTTARERFAPLGMPGSRYAVTLVLTVKRRGSRTDEILAELRKQRHAKVVGPDKDGRVVIRDDEGHEGEGRLRLRGSLHELAEDWDTFLQLQPPGEWEVNRWRERRARQRLTGT